MNVFYQAQCDALKRATWERTCPPASMLKTADPRIAAHLEICGHCRERFRHADGDAAFSRITLNSDVDAPHPGDIRRVSSKWISDTYEDDGWHQPPIVLVLNVDEEGLALVAQVHRYPELASLDDVVLSGLPDAWAEPWNTWSMPASRLNRRLATSTPQELDTVRKCCAGNAPVAEGILSVFHALEKRTGDYYHRLAIGSINHNFTLRLGHGFPSLARSHASEEDFRLAAAGKTETSLSRLAAFAGIPLQDSSSIRLFQHADVHYCNKDGTVLQTETVPASLYIMDCKEGKQAVVCIPWDKKLPIAVEIFGESSEGLLIDEPAVRNGELTFACSFSTSDIEKEHVLRTAIFVEAEDQ